MTDFIKFCNQISPLDQGATMDLLNNLNTKTILSQINFKASFGNVEKYADAIPGKVILFNMLSVLRLVFGALSLTHTFKAYSTKHL